MAPRTSEQFEAIRQERREEILHAALHVFSEEGYHSSSVASIAKKAKISKGLMYNYFESKEQVLRQLVVNLLDHAMEIMGIEPGEELTDQRMQEIIEASIDIPLQEPQHWKLYMSLVFQNDVAEILMQEMGDRLGPYLASLSGYFQGAGYEDPLVTMRIFSAILDGVQMHCLLDPEHFPAEQAKTFIIQQFTRK